MIFFMHRTQCFKVTTNVSFEFRAKNVIILFLCLYENKRSSLRSQVVVS